MFQNHVWVDVTRHNSNLPPLAVKNPECLGLLHKMDKNKEMWVQHYCILKDGCLFLYSGIRATHAYGMYTSCFIQDKSFFVCVFVFFVGVRYHKLDNNSKDLLAWYSLMVNLIWKIANFAAAELTLKLITDNWNAINSNIHKVIIWT